MPVDIDLDDVLRFQGYGGGRPQAPPAVLALVDEALGIARELMEPRAVVRWAPVERQEDDLIEAAGTTLAIRGVAREWGPVEWLAVAVATVGEPIAVRIAQLWDERDLPLAMMLDSVASGAAESVAAHLHDLFCHEAQPLGLTHPVSPGHRQWDLDGQRDLFRLCPGDAIGVHLNDAYFMAPEKSISLAAGAGRHVRVDTHAGKCARCGMRECTYRRTPARRR
jgi:cobalamin-dependent methionine synthase I